MATEFIVTDGHGKMDLMLALFDDKPGGRLRTVDFTVASHDHLFLKTRRDPVFRGRYRGLTHEQEAEVEIRDQDIGSHGLSLHVISVERAQGREYWEIVGNDVEDKTGKRVTLWYSTKTRMGSCKIEMPVRDEDGGTVGYE